MENFRNPKNIQRYDYVSYELMTPLQNPAVNNAQTKSGHRFNVDVRGNINPLDLYNGYIEIDFKIVKNDNTDYGANDNISIVNGAHSLISQLKTDYNGLQVLDSPNINHCVNVKNLLEFTDSYSKKIASSMFYYPDMKIGADFNEFNTANAVVIPGAGGNVPAHTPTRNADYNKGVC